MMFNGPHLFQISNTLIFDYFFWLIYYKAFVFRELFVTDFFLFFLIEVRTEDEVLTSCYLSSVMQCYL